MRIKAHDVCRFNNSVPNEQYFTGTKAQFEDIPAKMGETKTGAKFLSSSLPVSGQAAYPSS
jgi:hypothetical protein